MKSQFSQHFLKVPGQSEPVPVDKRVYDAWWQAENKEDYFTRRMKEERFVYDPEKLIAVFLPSREDSIDRLMEEGEEFAQEQPSVEHQVEVRVLMETILNHLSERELTFMRVAFFSDLTEEKASARLGMPVTTLRSKKQALLTRCRRILTSRRSRLDSS